MSLLTNSTLMTIAAFFGTTPNFVKTTSHKRGTDQGSRRFFFFFVAAVVVVPVRRRSYRWNTMRALFFRSMLLTKRLRQHGGHRSRRENISSHRIDHSEFFCLAAEFFRSGTKRKREKEREGDRDEERDEDTQARRRHQQQPAATTTHHTPTQHKVNVRSNSIEASGDFAHTQSKTPEQRMLKNLHLKFCNLENFLG